MTAWLGTGKLLGAKPRHVYRSCDQDVRDEYESQRPLPPSKLATQVFKMHFWDLGDLFIGQWIERKEFVLRRR